MSLQKTTLSRYAGESQWDQVYLATSADIVFFDSAVNTPGDSTGFGETTQITANTTAASLLRDIVSRLRYIDGTTLPALAAGTGLEHLSGSVIDSGTVDRDYLPADVSGKYVTVATETEKAALTASDVNPGDMVKVGTGKLYGVTSTTGGTITYLELTDNDSTLAWTRLSGIPTTFTHTQAEAANGAAYYVTNAVLTGDLVDSSSGIADAGKSVKLNSTGKLGFDITGDAATLGSHAASYFATQSDMTSVETAIGATGFINEEADGYTEGATLRSGMKGDIQTMQEKFVNFDASWVKSINGSVLPLNVIPKGAVERLFVISSLSILADNTANGFPADAGNGDTLQVDPSGNDGDAGKMYYITDDTKLGTANYLQGIQVYTAGSAASVDWSGVENTPTTLAGYGITDGVNVSEVVTTATANKILTLNEDAKLPASITGDAATVGGRTNAQFQTDIISSSEMTTRINTTTDPIIARTSALEQEVGLAQRTSVALVKDYINRDIDNLSGDEKAAYWLFTEPEQGEYGRESSYHSSSPHTGGVTPCIGQNHNHALDVTLNDETTIDDLAEAYVTAYNTYFASTYPTESVTYTHGSNVLVFSEDFPIALQALNFVEGLNENADGFDEFLGQDVNITTLVTGTAPALDPSLMARVSALETSAGSFDTDIAGLKAGTLIQALAASKLTGTVSRSNLPADVSGRYFEYASATALYTAMATKTAPTDVSTGDIVKLTDTNKILRVSDVNYLTAANGYTTLVDTANASIDWSQLLNIPTTVGNSSGQLNLTNVVLTTDVITNGLTGANRGGKLVAIDSTDNKLHVDIAGDAATLGGQQPSYYATQTDLEAIGLRAPIVMNSSSPDTSGLEVGQFALIPIASS